ncbi:hypothetical protein [Shewanella gaetbuli]
MKYSKIAASLALTLFSASTLAAGPLFINEKTMEPYKWDTSKGPIPVWTDGGPIYPTKDGGEAQAYTVDYDGTVFLSIEQANLITAKAIAEWTNVETSTFQMEIKGTIESQIGIADVNETNVDEVYYVENGYGFWVNYDTDGQILEQYFGVPRDAVLGIAFPEWANEETGEITEATALMNGWFVDDTDTQGDMIAGVFTHEFGHAINMSHSQANGHLYYIANYVNPQFDGVPGCEGVNTYKNNQWEGALANPQWLETMFPYINPRSSAGTEQATVNIKDDIVNISDLYPTPAYKAEYGSISGTLYTKEGVEFSGINLVARNLDNPYEDVITQQAGNMTQGMVGPDGKFTINGLTPGGRYVLYIESIKAGGYPTEPTPVLSVQEYWNEGESSSPSQDNNCAFTEIIVEAGQTKELEMHFNGYTDGIQYTPLVNATVIDHSKNGKQALGTINEYLFMYDSTKKEVINFPQDINGVPMISAANTAMNKTATKAVGVSDFNASGIKTPAVWHINNQKITPLEDVSNGTCNINTASGRSSASIWGLDGKGEFAVGTSQLPLNGENECLTLSDRTIGVPTVWSTITGKAKLLNEELKYVDASWGNSKDVILMDGDQEGRRTIWVRADRISEDSSVITGTTNNFGQVAWVNGKLRDTYTEFGAYGTSVISADGQFVGFGTQREGFKIWNTKTDEVTNIGGLVHCEDVPLLDRVGNNYCDLYPKEMLWNSFGKYSLLLAMDANDDLSLISVRSGTVRTGITGGFYLEGAGWMSTGKFFAKQGVAEAQSLMMDSPFGISANGSEIYGGIAGARITFDVDADRAYVCESGQDVELSFPKQVIQAVKKGAEFGRCAHLNDQF